MKEIILGIDLGTTNSAFGIIQDKKPKVLPVHNSPLLPSVVGISTDDQLLVGIPARNQWIVSPERTVKSIKRKMGSTEKVMMADKEYKPQEISAIIIKEIKKAAENNLGQEIKKAVITVPAYFNEVQREATLEAGKIAGLEVERIINEPTAAALAYGYGIKDAQNLQILVYDLGGGTFDVSVIELHEGIVDVIATTGNNLLGGDDFDELLANYLADQFQSDNDIDIREEHQAWARLLQAAEEAKIQLSSDTLTKINLEYLTKDENDKPLHLSQEVTRQEFEDIIDDLLEKTIELIDKALEDAQLGETDIDRILLIGGSTRIPAVWKKITRKMKKEPHMEINPDEAVALGAAVQAGIIAKEDIDTILVDVTPMSLGIECADFTVMGRLKTDIFAPLIHRNTTIPVHKSKEFFTMHPGQSSIHIKVYQGEDKVASKNILLGEFKVKDLKSDVRYDGYTKITVNFALDVNGILEVVVTDRGTGKKTKEVLKADHKRLSPEEIAKSQRKLADIYREPEATEEIPKFDEGTAALIKKANKILQKENLNESIADEIKMTIKNIQEAHQQNASETVEELCDDLIDLLMEAEE